ncbi:MAG: S49 family peptidase, partial [Candidatus Aminicenantales bacterium]
MKNKLIIILTLTFSLTGCAAHFHLDFLGKEKMAEVNLLPSPAKEKILLIDISGLLTSSLKPGVLEREGDILSRVYYRLQKAADDEKVRGLILRLDTPGGEVTASDILYHEILNYKKKTGNPVVALMMGLAASGGYYLASACDYIVAHPSTITGSIGVISIFPNLEELMKKIGV